MSSNKATQVAGQYAEECKHIPWDKEGVEQKKLATLIDTALAGARLEGAKAGIQAAVGWHEQKADECAEHGFKKQAESHRLDAYEISALDPQQVINESVK